MGKVKVLISNKQNAVKIPTGIRLLIRKCCHAVLINESFNKDAEISVSFVDNAEIRRLNSTFRDKDIATDVLSFPLGKGENFEEQENGVILLGDIVLSIEKALEQADLYNHSLEREVAFLTVHSMLHLLGYDHINGGMEAVRMREKEETVLNKLGLPRSASYAMPDEN